MPAKKRAKANMNGASAATSQAEAVFVQPRLSEEDKDKLRSYLVSHAQPFTVETTAITSKKRKRSGQEQLQEDLWEDRLTTQYDVTPRHVWDNLRRYKKFTVGSESITAGQYIFVKHDAGDEGDNLNHAEQWKAKVLEVRALESDHVYVRVAWLNRPEDLRGGRKPFHGNNELIPTNQMDVIDAMAFNGTFDLMQWKEDEEDAPMPKEDEFFWRQTYDFANGGRFSKLRQICVDNKPINPDRVIIQCSSVTCRKWLHVQCIADKAIKKHRSANNAKKAGAANTSKKRGRAKTENVEAVAQATAEVKVNNEEKTITAAVFVKGLPDGPNSTPSASSEVVLIDVDGQEHAEDLVCLACSEPIVDD